MSARRLTEAELDANIEPWHLPHMQNYANDSALPYCTGACDQGRSACACETGMPQCQPLGRPVQMFDVETERPLLSSALCALAIVATIAISALLAGCGGSDDEAAAAPDTPSPQAPACSASGACA